MTKHFGLITETSHTERATFRGMEDACHTTLAEAFSEATAFYLEEPRVQLGGYHTKVIGIFSVDYEGNFSHELNRKQIIDAIETAAANTMREEDGERRYGSYTQQHEQRTGDVL